MSSRSSGSSGVRKAPERIARELRARGRATARHLLGENFERRRRAAWRARMAREFREFMMGQIGGFFVETDPGPVWSRELLLRTAIMSEEQIPAALDADRFLANSYKQLLWHLRALVENGMQLRTAGSCFEFGCGSARLIRHMRSLEGVALVASDVIPDSIEWCRQNIPGIRFEVNDHDPPLAFAKDDEFDIVLAHSVFTHIPLATQTAWIRELRRVLRPGGYASCSVHGRIHARAMLDETRRQQLARDRSLELTASDPEASESTRVTGTWDVFQTRAEIIDTFRHEFVVRDYRHGGQDLLVLQKPR